MNARASWPLLSTVLVSLVACGSSDDAPTPGPDGGVTGGAGGAGGAPSPGDCITVSVVPPVTWSGANTFWGDHLGAQIDIDLGGGGYHKLSIRFRGDQQPGTYPLGTSDNGTFSSCQQCVMVMQNVWGDNVNTLNFAASGRILLEQVNADRGEFKGRVDNVVLAPLLYDQEQHHQWGDFDPAQSDDCLHLGSVAFDTFAGVGSPCDSSSDCINKETQVCDPRLGECVESQCNPDDGTGCPDDDVCLEQHAGYHTGSCYPSCIPFASGVCEAGYDCTSTTYWGDAGVCKKQGVTPVGETCEPSTSETGCEPGAVCQTWSPFWGSAVECYETCDYFGQPQCTTGTCVLKFYRTKDSKQYCYSGRCHLGGTCKDVEVDNAGFGEGCVEAERWCAVEGKVARGFCDAAGGSVCRRVCRLGRNDCPSGTCTQLIANEGTAVEGMGVCTP